MKNRYYQENMLVQRCRNGDRAALTALIKLFHPKLIRMISCYLKDSRPVEDIAQDCWYAIIKQLPNIKLRIGFSTWAAGIARRKAIDWIHRQQRDRNRSGKTDVYDLEDIETAVTENESDSIEMIRTGIRQLSPARRIILEMFYLENLSLREISKVLNVPEGTIKSRLFYAREDLKEIIKNQKEV